jgi:hypothetical protein
MFEEKMESIPRILRSPMVLPLLGILLLMLVAYPKPDYSFNISKVSLILLLIPKE